jgi:hypothetical protein
LEVRLRNSAVDNSGSWPARSLARTDQKNHTKTKAPTTSRMSISQMLSSAARMPMTIRTRPTADRTAPPVSKGRVGSAGRGSWIRRLNRMIAAMTSASSTVGIRPGERSRVVTPGACRGAVVTFPARIPETAG